MVLLDTVDDAPASDRIRLRPAEARDLSVVRDASTDPLIPLITTVPNPFTDEAGAAYLQRQHDRPRQGIGLSLMVEDIAMGQAVGQVYVNLLSLAVGVIEIGYWTAPSQHGKGYASEALGLLRDWVPSRFGVDRLTLYIDPENTGSLRTAAACGFQAEVELPGYERVGDEFRPMVRFGWGSGGGDPGTVARLEERMWANGYRDAPEWFDRHLHPEFVEVGASGRRWSRAELLAKCVGAIECARPLPDLAVDMVDDACALVTYRSVQPHRTAHRTSLWLRAGDGSWSLRHHQGTVAV